MFLLTSTRKYDWLGNWYMVSSIIGLSLVKILIRKYYRFLMEINSILWIKSFLMNDKLSLSCACSFHNEERYQLLMYINEQRTGLLKSDASDSLTPEFIKFWWYWDGIMWDPLDVKAFYSQPAKTCSNLTIGQLKQCVKCFQK